MNSTHKPYQSNDLRYAVNDVRKTIERVQQISNVCNFFLFTTISDSHLDLNHDLLQLFIIYHDLMWMHVFFLSWQFSRISPGYCF